MPHEREEMRVLDAVLQHATPPPPADISIGSAEMVSIGGELLFSDSSVRGSVESRSATVSAPDSPRPLLRGTWSTSPAVPSAREEKAILACVSAVDQISALNLRSFDALTMKEGPIGV